MRVSYVTDRINQLDDVEEILINEGTIEFVLFHRQLSEKIDLQNFFVSKGTKDVKVYISRTDGRVETWLKLDEKYTMEFIPEKHQGSYQFGCKMIEKRNTRSIQITELYPETW